MATLHPDRKERCSELPGQKPNSDKNGAAFRLAAALIAEE
jgi:hypothetical protein